MKYVCRCHLASVADEAIRPLTVLLITAEPVIPIAIPTVKAVAMTYIGKELQLIGKGGEDGFLRPGLYGLRQPTNLSDRSPWLPPSSMASHDRYIVWSDLR